MLYSKTNAIFEITSYSYKKDEIAKYYHGRYKFAKNLFSIIKKTSKSLTSLNKKL